MNREQGDTWIGALVVAGALTLGAIAGNAWARLDDRPRVPCFEDQVYAVQLDPDPSHGLTWACEDAQGFAWRTLEPRNEASR